MKSAPEAPSLTTADWQHICQGIALYNDGAFWDAHEAWEGVWRRYPDDWRLFLQGLIQIAAGYYQLRRCIFHDTVKHLENARAKLAQFPDDFLGIDVAALIDGIDATLALVTSQGRDGLEAIPNDCFPQIKMIISGENDGKPLDR